MKVVVFAVVALIPLSPFAADIDLLVDGSGTLRVSAADGSIEVVEVPFGTVRKEIAAGDQKFRVSFGEDTSGLVAAILEPALGEGNDVKVRLVSRDPVAVSEVQASATGGVQLNATKIAPGRKAEASSETQYLHFTKDASCVVFWRGVGRQSPLAKGAQPSKGWIDVKVVPSL